MGYSFEHITPDSGVWAKIESSPDSTVFHSKKWSEYLDKIGYQPYICSVYEDGTNIGFFVGERIKRGITLVTAPFEGIGTYTQGLALNVPVSEDKRVEIYSSLAKWFFNTRQCALFQVDDWNLRRDYDYWIPNSEFHQDAIERAGVELEVRPTLHVDLTKSVEELWARLHYKSCKYCVNKANRLGLHVRVVENRHDISRFCKNHFSQLTEVCASKGMAPKPSQSEERMNAVCNSLFPDRVLMVEVIGKDENCIEQIMSSGIFCYDKGESIYWTGASYQRYQKYCPNELMVWEAMKMLHEKGAGNLNFGGMASYKLKFGTVYAYVPRMIFYKFRFVFEAKTFARTAYHWFRNTLALIKGRKSFK